MSSDANDSLSPSARIADIVTALLVAIAAWLAVVGIGRSIVSSPLLVLYTAAGVQIVRHLLWPRPHALWHLKATHARVMERTHVAAVVYAFLATRPAVFLVALFSVLTIGLASNPGVVLSRDPLANLPARFDAGWYGGIALDGYSWDHTFQRPRNIAFFPALPMLMRPVGAAFGMMDRTVPRERRMVRALWAGVVISLGAFLWGLYYFVRLGTDLIGPEPAAAAALLLSSYPFALFYSVPYTESLFLLGATGACYHFLRRDWFAASCFGLLVGLTRPNGCFVSIPLAILGAQQIYEGAKGAKSALGAKGALSAVTVRLVTAAMPGIGMLLFTAYLYNLTGVWFAWARSHEAWGRTYQGFGPFVTAFGWLRDEPFLQVVTNIPFNTLNTLGVLFGLALTYHVFRRLGLAWGVFILVNLLPPLFAGGVLSMGRLSATLFPLFLALATLLPARSVPAWAAAFGIGQGLCATLFFTWRELF
jgi:hypothetical protein